VGAVPAAQLQRQAERHHAVVMRALLRSRRGHHNAIPPQVLDTNHCQPPSWNSRPSHPALFLSTSIKQNQRKEIRQRVGAIAAERCRSPPTGSPRPPPPRDAADRGTPDTGRPCKPTVAEARQAALDGLVARALRVLKAHLGDDSEVNPNAWPAALKLFEYAYGREPEQEAELRGE
jgi:hypothetical protein